MEVSTIFSYCNKATLFGWVLLLFFPKWKYTQYALLRGLVLFFSLLYVFLVLKGIEDFKLKSFSSLYNVKVLFLSDVALTAGWLHYLAFDLFVGAYIVKISIKEGIPRVIYSIILPLTFLFGPLGYLVFSLVRIIKNKTFLFYD